MVAQSGTLEDAIAAACSVNREHDRGGLARTNADKRRAVETLLTLEAWKSKSTRLIAEHCGVSNATVARVKDELLQSNNSLSDTVETKDGKRYPAKQKQKAEKKAEESGQEGSLLEAETDYTEPFSVYTLQSEEQYTNGKDIQPYYTGSSRNRVGKFWSF